MQLNRNKNNQGIDLNEVFKKGWFEDGRSNRARTQKIFDK
jgi:hypothetical protein